MARSTMGRTLLALLLLLSSVQLALSKIITINTTDGSWLPYTDPDTGKRVWLENNRRPALYTGDFGDCMGDGLVDVTRFDAAYYKDNHTINVHWAGSSDFMNQSVMISFAVYAYGKVYWDMAVDPCGSNIRNLCPMNSSIPIETTFSILLGPHDAQQIPDIATTIPDFEGQAIMRIFANTSTQGYGGQLACFSAKLTNGNTFSHPAIVGSVLGFFAFVAFIASVTTAVYGDDVPIMRTHYAHSLSVFVVFAVFQHIFFTGALSMNWPSVLPAFWSNFAWSGGMIYSESMQNSLRKFVGAKTGSTSEVGAAASGTYQELGGYDVHKIFPRSSASPDLLKRELTNRTSGYSWYGYPVQKGVPLPGNYSGFAGTLSVENIPASNAFMTGFIWFIIVLAAVVGSVAAFKGAVELLVRAKRIRKARLSYFRSHWLRYCAVAALRTCYIGFFALVFLALFQFTYNAAAGPVAIAAIVFIVVFVGMFAIAGYACFYRLNRGRWISEPDRVRFEQQRLLKVIPVLVPVAAHAAKPDDGRKYLGSVPFWRLSHVKPEDESSVHDDIAYIQSFGWLNARFRRTRWWYFAAWLVYEFVRACFLGGASGHALRQVFGLLVVEIIACICLFYFKPFEGQRLNALVVYCLGFSKVITVALSAAFDISFNMERIPTTAIGIVIIVIQGILTIILLIAIILGAISSWFSVTRYRSDEKFRPRGWLNLRNRYVAHVEQAALDVPPPPKPEPPKVEEPQVPKGPYFNVNSVKRNPKVEDEDEDFQSELHGEKDTYYFATEHPLEDADLTPSPNEQQDEILAADDRARRRSSRALSMHSTHSRTSLPFGARAHRASWTRDVVDNYSLMDPAAFVEPPPAAPAMRHRYSDLSTLEQEETIPTRPRVSSRATLGARPTSHRYSSGEMPVLQKRMSLGAESFQMERSHPDYIASLNQAFGSTSDGRPKSTGDLLQQVSSTTPTSPVRPPSARSMGAVRPGPVYIRSTSGGSAVEYDTPPQSPTNPLMASPSRERNRRGSNRHSMHASGALNPYNAGFH